MHLPQQSRNSLQYARALSLTLMLRPAVRLLKHGLEDADILSIWQAPAIAKRRSH